MPLDYLQLCEYSTLAAAYQAVTSGVPPDLDERTTNLLNHLVWGSYISGKDPINDEIVKAALRRLFQSADSIDLDPELQALVESLDMEGEEHERWQI